MDFKNIEFESMDINVIIGNILFNIIIDSSFFNSADDYSFPCHNHGSFEVHCIEKGSGQLIVNEKNIPLSSGICCLIAPNVFHTQKDQPDDRINKYCMKFAYQVLKRNSSTVPVPEIHDIITLLSSDICFSWTDEYHIIDLIKLLQNEISSKKIGYYTYIQSCFMQMIVLIIRAISANTTVDYDITKKNIDQKRSIIIESFFYQNYMHNAHINDLALQLGVCVRQVDRIIRRYFNLSFKEKLLETRIDLAKDYLKNSHENVNIISEKVGYTLPGNFSRIFKQKTGVSPEEFRTKVLAASQDSMR